MISIEDFTEEARAFLAAHWEPKKEEAAFEWGEGSDELTTFDEFTQGPDSPEMAETRRWAALRYDAGFGWIDGPAELGGRGLSADHARAYRELEDTFEVPSTAILGIATGFIAPTVLRHASAEVQREYLPKMYRGDLIVCQLFSEPNAGSDLASAQTRAVRDGDEWVLNGQKVWTSNAQVADIGLAVTRTNPQAPKHHGLTTFLVDMHAVGVEVRPLIQMTGGAGFNEVFLTDVRVPDRMRVGEVDAGFGVIITTLSNERTTAMRTSFGPSEHMFERLLGVAEHYSDRKDGAVRQQLAKIYSYDKINSYMAIKMAAQVATGGNPGPETMILKLAGARQRLEIVDFLTSTLGSRLCADNGQWGTFGWGGYVLGAPGKGIGGGTIEIVRNRIGETALGLPREPPPTATRTR